MVAGPAAWITDQLELHRIPQKDLAAALGLDPSAVTRLLKGQRKLKDAELPILQAFFARYGAASRLPPPRLVRALSMKGIDVNEVARRSGVPEYRILEIKLGQGAEPDEEERGRLAAAFGQEPDFLFSAAGLPDSARESVREGWRIADRPRGAPAAYGAGDTIPVYRPLPRLQSRIYAAEFVLAARMQAPERLRGVPGAFGVHVADDDAAPMLLRGDVYFVDPGRPALRDERAFVRFGNGEVAVGVLVFDGYRPRLDLAHRRGSPFVDAPGDSIESIVVVVAR